MINLKKILSLVLVGTMALGVFAGCSRQEEEEVTYSLVPKTAEELEAGKYYVKNAETFYELPAGLRNFDDGGSSFRGEADPTRVLWFGPDDVTIPTLYQDDTLVFVTESLPDSFTWERFKDNGYTVGVAGLAPSNTGAFATAMEGVNFYPNSSIKNKIAESGSQVGDMLVFDSVDKQKISSGNVSGGGTILGLTFNKTYNVDVYNGSKYIQLTEVVADTHAFNSFEVYNSSICNYMQANYIQIVIPDSFVSGYYLIDGVGFVRYVKGPRSKGITDVDFNAPYYLYDAEGNLITADQVVDPDTGVVVKDDDPYYSNVVNVDCSNLLMTVTLRYQDATTTNIDGSTITLSDDEVGLPTVKLYDPDGNELNNFVPSNTEKNALTMTVQNPVPGKWETRVWNAQKRMFTMETAFTSGHSDTLDHQGNKAVLTYYIPNNMRNAQFKITWANATLMPDNQDGIIIRDSGQNSDDGKEIKFVRDTGNSNHAVPFKSFNEKRGEVVLELGEVKYGDYHLDISCSSGALGRVRVEVVDLNPYEETEAQQPAPEETPEEVVDPSVETTEVPAEGATEAATDANAEATN